MGGRGESKMSAVRSENKSGVMSSLFLFTAMARPQRLEVTRYKTQEKNRKSMRLGVLPYNNIRTLCHLPREFCLSRPSPMTQSLMKV